MEFLKQQFYPHNTEHLIKEQYKTENELYVVTYFEWYWRLHTLSNKKTVLKTKEYQDIKNFFIELEQPKKETKEKKKRKTKAS